MERSARDRGVDGGRIVIALGAILLLVSLFLDWFGASRGFGDEAISAWTSFEIVDLLLALIALAAIVAALEPFARGSSHIPDSAGAIAGPLALVLVLASIISRPPLLQSLETDLEVGAWLALAGAAVMCAGALLALNRVSLVVTPRERAGAGADTRVHETRTQPLPPDPKA